MLHCQFKGLIERDNSRNVPFFEEWHPLFFRHHCQLKDLIVAGL